MGSMKLRIMVRSGLRNSALAAVAASSLPLAATSLCALLPGSSAQAAQTANRQIDFNIAAQSVETALLEFSKQADMQVMVGAAVGTLAEQRTAGVEGRLDVAAALRKLLRNTDLHAIVRGNTVTVQLNKNSAVSDATPLKESVLLTSDTTQYAVRSEESSASSAGGKSLDEVVVTGTQIRGAAPVGANVTIIGREEIANSGYSNVHDMLMSRPEFSGAGASEVQSARTLDSGATNFNRGTALNLRGLGADSTLVLINGRRQPGSGVNGAFVDVSTIPAVAIERVEILPDGASALYGSDAVGGVVNFLLRRDFEGAESSARVVGYDGGSNEVIASQVLGKTWGSGNVLVGYQYSDRDSLPNSDRSYARADLRAFGGGDYRQPRCNPGNILSPTTGQPAFAIPTGQNGSALTTAQLVPGGRLCENPFDLLAEQTSHAVFVTFSQAAGERVEFFADARYARRSILRNNGGFATTLSVPSTNPYYINPFGGTANVSVAYNFGRDLGNSVWDGLTKVYSGSAGMNVQLFGDWEGRLVGSYGRDDEDTTISNVQSQGTALTLALADRNRATAFNPFGDGSNSNPATIDSFRGAQVETGTSTDKSGSVIFNGSLFHLPAGAVKAAVGADYLKLNVDARSRATGRADALFDADRDITAYFGEVRVPVIAAAAGIPLLHSLEISAAIRTEDYSDFGDTTNEKYGLTWSLTDAFDVRATWGNSFKAPRLNQIVAIPGVLSTADRVLSVVDPQSPTGRVNALVRLGNNANLQPETADVWTVGLDYVLADGPAFHATYFNVDYRNRIARGGPTGNSQAALAAESEWASIIIRNPTAAQLSTICAEGFVVGACPTVGSVGAVLDVRYRNLASVQLQGLDIGADIVFHTGLGQLRLAVAGTYMLSFEQSIGPASPDVEYVGTYANPARLRLRTSASWHVGAWNVSGDVNFSSHERDLLSVGVRGISSWTTLDLGVGYDFEATSGLLSGLGLSARAVNVTNESPPFADVSGVGFDPANTNLYGRIVSLQLNKKW